MRVPVVRLIHILIVIAMNNYLKTIIKSHSGILSCVYYILMNNRVYGKKQNRFKWQNVFMRGLRIKFYGKNNEVILGAEARPSILTNCCIEVHGSNNRIIIGGGVGAKDLKIYCADKNCMVQVKDDTQIAGMTELATMEGTKIVVGRDCLFSANITLRAGDSHSVVDAISGERLNPSKDIVIGDHVWIGNTVIVTKGTTIGDNSVVATGAVVAGKAYPVCSAIGGNPAKVIKEGINWRADKV